MQFPPHGPTLTASHPVFPCQHRRFGAGVTSGDISSALQASPATTHAPSADRSRGHAADGWTTRRADRGVPQVSYGNINLNSVPKTSNPTLAPTQMGYGRMRLN
eukprot:COSAG02_NODE_471_length_21662_cov_70.510040_14_plen_104_part_00